MVKTKEYQKELDAWAEWVRKDRKRNPKRYIYYRTKQRAKMYGIRFSLLVSDIPDIPKTCPIFPWIRLKWHAGKGRRLRPDAISIDKINPRRGYVPGNVRIISMRANMLKSNGTKKEFEAILKDLRSRRSMDI